MRVTPPRTSDESITTLPKAELHLHIEGTLEPELAFAAGRPQRRDAAATGTSSALARAYDFADLGLVPRSVLRVHGGAADGRRTSRSRRGLPRPGRADGVVRAEMFFDPQAHLSRGVALAEVIGGLTSAAREQEAARRPVRRADRLLPARPRSGRGDAHARGAGRRGVRTSSRVGLDSAEVGLPAARLRRGVRRGGTSSDCTGSPTPARRVRPTTSGRRSTCSASSASTTASAASRTTRCCAAWPPIRCR